MTIIEHLFEDVSQVDPPEAFKANAYFKDQSIYTDAQTNRLAFWDTQAKALDWITPWHTVLEWKRPFAKWFVGGQLNACYNCVDRHLDTHRNEKPAIIWQGEDDRTVTLTYRDLYKAVNQFAHILSATYHIKKGDRVTLYMPLIPQLAIAVLACARLGAIHSVVFGGFSAESLRDRLHDSGSALLITADGGFRRGKHIPLKEIVDKALEDKTVPVRHVLVIKHLGLDTLTMVPNRDSFYDDLVSADAPTVPPEAMSSEDPLFILYTSGTTGKPKGIIHSSGGYLTHAHYSTKAVFDIKDSDVFWCTADIGWITGHTYVIYGPLSNGATIFMYEGVPDYPNAERFWELIDTHKVSIFYTAPTAIRSFMKLGPEFPNKYKLDSLRLLGSVGEPINPEAWRWYYTHIGRNKCPIVDTWWQTETGGIMISNIPSLNPMKPGKAGLPLPGIEAKILDEKGVEVTSGGGLLSITEPWPSMLRGIWGDTERFKEVYWSKFDTYFAGDGATKDADGYYMVLGRVDDVLNVAGHRIGTMEIESALVDHPSVAEAAVVGIADDIKGQAILAFVILKSTHTASPELEQALIAHVSQKIGAIAKPKQIIVTPDLPKTRSGKIMRRVLQALVNRTPVGDIATLANPDIVELLTKQLQGHK